jgi:phage baseplate assembly protein W
MSTARIDIAYPFGFDTRGRTATADYPSHVRQMIEQLLLTNPGERVNRPDFGAGLRQHVFGPNSPEVAAAVELTLQSALARWLGDVVEVRALEVTSEESQLSVRLEYLLRGTGQERSDDVTVSTQ